MARSFAATMLTQDAASRGLLQRAAKRALSLLAHHEALLATLLACSCVVVRTAAAERLREQTARLHVSATVVTTCTVATQQTVGAYGASGALQLSCGGAAQPRTETSEVRTLASDASVQVQIATVNF